MAQNSDKKSKLSAAFPSRNTNTSSSGLQIDPVENLAFDMTAILAAAQTYISLNSAVNNLLGMEVRWFRAVPQLRSQDVIFQEYTLYNVADDPLCLKVMLPDGNFPDSRYDYDLYGLQYEVPLEIHIDKAYWEGIAGFGTAPQKKDIVYFAVPNKLYQVESSYLLRGFMEQETTWKCNLRKYQPEAARKEGDSLTQTIEQYTVSEESIFGEVIDANIAKIVDDKQFSPFNTTERDMYKIIDTSVNLIKSSQLDIFGTIVAESYYDLSISDVSVAIKYPISDNITTSQDRSISIWTKVIPPDDEYEVEYIQADTLLTPPANYKISIKTPNQGFDIGDTFVLTRPGELNFYGTVIDIVSSIYYVYIDQTVKTYLTSLKSNWVSARNYKMKVQEPVNILNGIDDEGNSDFIVNIYANQYIKVNYGEQEYTAILTDKMLDNEWYGIIVNIGNVWGQYNVYVWKQHDTDVGDPLQNVFYETIDFTPEAVEIEYYQINRSFSHITNIRLYGSTIEEEKMSNELLRIFIKDADKAIIADNCDPKFKAPYIGQQR